MYSKLWILARFIGEESAAAGKKYEFTDAPTWIIGFFNYAIALLIVACLDPIDGTTNFVHRLGLLGIEPGVNDSGITWLRSI